MPHSKFQITVRETGFIVIECANGLNKIVIPYSPIATQSMSRLFLNRGDLIYGHVLQFWKTCYRVAKVYSFQVHRLITRPKPLHIMTRWSTHGTQFIRYNIPSLRPKSMPIGIMLPPQQAVCAHFPCSPTTSPGPTPRLNSKHFQALLHGS